MPKEPVKPIDSTQGSDITPNYGDIIREKGKLDGNRARLGEALEEINDTIDYSELKPEDLGTELYRGFKFHDNLLKDDENGKYLEIDGQKYRYRNGEYPKPSGLIYCDFGKENNDNFFIGPSTEEKGFVHYSRTQGIKYIAGEFNDNGKLNGKGIRVWQNGNIEKGHFNNGKLGSIIHGG